MFALSGITVSYYQPDEYTSLQISNFYINPDESSTVINLKWSPDYKVLCALYETGVFALFSVFGALLYSSKETM